MYIQNDLKGNYGTKTISDLITIYGCQRVLDWNSPLSHVKKLCEAKIPLPYIEGF